MKNKYFIVFLLISVIGFALVSCSSSDDEKDPSAFDFGIKNLEQCRYAKSGGVKTFKANVPFDALSSISINDIRVYPDQIENEFKNEHFRCKIIDKQIVEIELFENKTSKDFVFDFTFRKGNFFKILTLYQAGE